MYVINKLEYDCLKEETNNRTIFTTYEWLTFLKNNQNGIPIVLELKEDDKRVALFVGLIINKYGIRILGSPFNGWLTPDMGFIIYKKIDYVQAAKEIAAFSFKKLHCIFVQIQDKGIGIEKLNNKICFEKTRLLHIDGNKELDNILQNFTKNGRRDVRASARKGIEVRKVPFDRNFVDIHYEQLIDVFAKQNLKPFYSKQKLYDLVEALSSKPQYVLALEAFWDEKCVASIFTFGFNEWAYYMGAASFREHQKYLPNEALFWEFISYWHARGVKHFDLVGYREYKLKYNPEIISSPILMFSKYPGLIWGRKMAKSILKKCRARK